MQRVEGEEVEPVGVKAGEIRDAHQDKSKEARGVSSRRGLGICELIGPDQEIG